MSEIVTASSLYTASRQDFSDYLRCPKIVAIKTYRSTRTKQIKAIQNRSEEMTTAVIGHVGEAATELVFSKGTDGLLESSDRSPPTALENQVLETALSRVRGLNVQVIRDDVRSLVTQTLAGLLEIKADVGRAYGGLEVIGRGETRYGALPTSGFPDYVAITQSGKPVLIEVKNTIRQNPRQDGFQAAFYNSLGRTAGVVVQTFNQKEDVSRASLTVVLERDAHTLLLYPRLHTWANVTDTVDINSETLEKIWEAKELGALGKVPRTECGNKCPHHRYGIELPEDTIDVVGKPLPLVLTKGALDLGTDLDLSYLQRYVWATAPALMNRLYGWSHTSGVPMSMRKTVRDILRDDLGLDDSSADKVLSHYLRKERTETTEVETIMKEMAAEIEPWQRILPKKLVTEVGTTAHGVGTRIYRLPAQSSELVHRAWKRW